MQRIRTWPWGTLNRHPGGYLPSRVGRAALTGTLSCGILQMCRRRSRARHGFGRYLGGGKSIRGACGLLFGLKGQKWFWT